MNKRFGPPSNAFMVGILILSLIVTSQPITAAVNDNLDSLTVQIASFLGLGKEDENNGVYGGSLVERVNTIHAEMSALDSKLDKVSRQVSNQSAIAGGGCYYTIYSSKEYLEGYKLKLSDGTSSKSCYIQYDEDSDYYAGVLKAPLNNELSIEIIDPETGRSQGKVSTTAVPSNGYATVNLDPLIESNLADLLTKDDSLALHFSQDSDIVCNDTYFPVVLNHVYDVNHDVDKFLHALTGDEYSSTTFEELLENETEFINAVAGDTSHRSILSQLELTNSIINDREKLRWISTDIDSKEAANVNTVFTTAIRGSQLIEEQTMPGGQENKVDGNIICVSVESGAIGKAGSSIVYSTGYHNDGFYWGCNNISDTNKAYKAFYVSSRPDSYVGSERLIGNTTIAKYRCYTQCGSCGSASGDTTSDLSGDANKQEYSGKYTNVVTVEEMSGTYSASCENVTVSCSASDAAANSVITYIDLDVAV